MSALFPFDNSFARDLPGACVAWQGARFPAPRLLRLNSALALELGLDPEALATDEGATVLAGAEPPEGGAPVAMVYAGHQFGQFSPRLGDGRALLLGEVIDRNGCRRDIHLKGSGPTPFSRGGDGKAALGPVLREYLMGEAMQALGIPTTRALAAVLTGEQILRDGPKPGAVLVRVAQSHLRVGTFEYFAARGDLETLRALADYAIHRHDPDLEGREDRVPAFLARVASRQAQLIARWMLVGFIHGVMNTDNMAISGETIDYGPCAFLDAFNPRTVFSSIDHQGRYAYGNQPRIALWNLARLGEALLPLMPGGEEGAVELANTTLQTFGTQYGEAFRSGMRAKLGLVSPDEAGDTLIPDLQGLMLAHEPDFTQLFRSLADAAEGNGAQTLALLGAGEGARGWLERWQARLAGEPPGAGARIRVASPVYIPRNHIVEAALSAAIEGDMAPFDALMAVLANPFTDQPGREAYAQPAPPDSPPHRTFCGT